MDFAKAKISLNFWVKIACVQPHHLLWHYIFRFLEHCALAPRPDWMTTLETPIADAEVERMTSNNSENYGENISSHSDPSKDPSSIDYYTKVTTNDLKNDLSIAGSK